MLGDGSRRTNGRRYGHGMDPLKGKTRDVGGDKRKSRFKEEFGRKGGGLGVGGL